jgi:hypothetical protein
MFGPWQTGQSVTRLPVAGGPYKWATLRVVLGAASSVVQQAISRGREKADAEVAERLCNRAMGYDREAVKIFMPAGAKEPVYAPYTRAHTGRRGPPVPHLPISFAHRPEYLHAGWHRVRLIGGEKSRALEGLGRSRPCAPGASGHSALDEAARRNAFAGLGADLCSGRHCVARENEPSPTVS